MIKNFMNNNQSEKIQIEAFTARKMEKFRYQSKKSKEKSIDQQIYSTKLLFSI